MKKLLSLILAILITLTLFASCGKAEKALTATELLDLGEKYLLDLDYEQAIVYFNKVIEVEPKNKSAYLGLAEAYVGLNDTESAIDILETALDVFSDDDTTLLEIYARLAEIDSGNYVWYIEPAEVYISLDNTDSAISVLEQGLENATRTEEIEELLSELLGETEEETEADEIEEVVEEVEDEPIYKTTLEYYHGYFSDADSSWEEYEYDSDWNLISYRLYEPEWGGYSNQRGYEYDSDGKLVKTLYYNNDGTVDSTEEYEYDSSGNLLSEIRYYSDGSVWYHYEYEYDSDGNQITRAYYTSDGSLSWREEYEYDSYGSEINYTRYNSDGSVSYGFESEYEYEYDSDGNMTKKICYYDGSISSVFEYNADGDTIKYTYYNSDGSISEQTTYVYEYEYDSDDRIIGRTILQYNINDFLTCTVTQVRIN